LAKVPRLKDCDPGDTGKFKHKDEARELTEALQKRLHDLLYLMFAEARRSLVVILHGIDASGKDGTIQHIFTGANPQGVQVHSFKKPTPEELRHDFLWRCHKAMPEAGTTALFNRSYYEEVTTVKVHPELLNEEHLPREIAEDPNLFKMRYAQINDFEKMLTENGVTLVKCLLHITKEEQKERLDARVEDPQKNWKFEPQDLVERKFWDQYMKAFEEMLQHTHTKHAPWHVIPADHKWYRNYEVSNLLVDKLSGVKMKFPKAKKA
jgi:PPK2 family polyphosphate:nucleotide phosphotransferase